MFLAKYPHNFPKHRDVFLYISTRYTKKSYTLIPQHILLEINLKY